MRRAQIVSKACPLMPPGAQSYTCSHGRFYWVQMGWQRLLFREGVHDSIELRYVRRRGGRALLSPKSCLRVLENGWLYPREREKAHKMGKDKKMTQEQAEIELRKLEHEVSDRLGTWKMYQ